MALNLEQLQGACGFDGAGPRIWTYKTQDSIGNLAGQIQEAGYFDGASSVLAAGDFIIALTDADVADAGSLTSVLAVRSNVGGVVTVSPAANDLSLG